MTREVNPLSEQVHKFNCENDHVFYVPLQLPQPIEKVGKVFKRIRCPYCRSTHLYLHFENFALTQMDDLLEEIAEADRRLCEHEQTDGDNSDGATEFRIRLAQLWRLRKASQEEK